MKIILRIIEILLGLLAISTILVIIFLFQPDWSPFQPTFGVNLIPVASVVAAWTTLLVAYAAFKTINNSNKLESQRRKDAQVAEIIKWAEDIGTRILDIGTPQDEQHIRKVITTDSMALTYLESRFEIAELLRLSRMRSIYIKEISKNDPYVQKSIEGLIEYLRRKLRLSYKYKQNEENIKNKGGLIKAAINVAKNEYELYNSIVEFLKLIGNISSLY
jgi:hypothetical protein